MHVTQTHGRSLFLVLRKQPAEIKNSAVRHTFEVVWNFWTPKCPKKSVLLQGDPVIDLFEGAEKTM